MNFNNNFNTKPITIESHPISQCIASIKYAASKLNPCSLEMDIGFLRFVDANRKKHDHKISIYTWLTYCQSYKQEMSNVCERIKKLLPLQQMKVMECLDELKKVKSGSFKLSHIIQIVRDIQIFSPNTFTITPKLKNLRISTKDCSVEFPLRERNAGSGELVGSFNLKERTYAPVHFANYDLKRLEKILSIFLQLPEDEKKDLIDRLDSQGRIDCCFAIERHMLQARATSSTPSLNLEDRLEKAEAEKTGLKSEIIRTRDALNYNIKISEYDFPVPFNYLAPISINKQEYESDQAIFTASITDKNKKSNTKRSFYESVVDAISDRYHPSHKLVIGVLYHILIGKVTPEDTSAPQWKGFLGYLAGNGAFNKTLDHNYLWPYITQADLVRWIYEAPDQTPAGIQCHITEQTMINAQKSKQHAAEQIPLLKAKLAELEASLDKGTIEIDRKYGLIAVDS